MFKNELTGKIFTTKEDAESEKLRIFCSIPPAKASDSFSDVFADISPEFIAWLIVAPLAYPKIPPAQALSLPSRKILPLLLNCSERLPHEFSRLLFHGV